MARTYYDVLGVEESASTADIEAAYRERLKETHPDVTDDPDATDTVQEVIDARDVLTDEAERARYDRLGHEAYVSGDPTGTASASARESTDEGAGETHSAASAHSQSDGSSTSVGDNTRVRSGSRDATRGQSSTPTDRDRTWAHGSGGRVTQPGDPNTVRWSRLFPPNQSVVLLLAAFICYPPFVLFSVYPPFPAVFNLIVAACTLALVGYLISLPEIGVLVFGFWGLVTAGSFLIGSLGMISLSGVLAMTATWLPLGLSIVVFRLIRH
ncbi:DnaJ type Zn finger domain [Halorhabdus sp. SVX81]|uniref:J domain-containing protein n=1 Tax=Halorhabdus sp. SVX81 TaxID=2978283 RepID=UPI0023D9F4F3|nr:DnaJ domain-containing protein [Halorhabdus sp. SVX81]WEL16980.1 DnaJ type Zn finger domain [Halorhabdus sp. SVX81]